jgi:hypothetical protein
MWMVCGEGGKKCLGLGRGMGGCEGVKGTEIFILLALRRVCHMPSKLCAESGIFTNIDPFMGLYESSPCDALH